LVMHTLTTLSGAITNGAQARPGVVWSTFYDIRRYGGLQIFLRAMLQGGSLVLSSPHESIGDFLVRLGIRGATHISGTPSHWRRALMSKSADAIAPKYVRLSGEVAEQAILDQLRDYYPGAHVAHAFASTEAGVGFDVPDGLAGFPASLIGHRGPVEMKVVDGSLRIRSARTAIRYVGNGLPSIFDAEGFVDTGDLLELDTNRYYFIGRRDGVINVGGLKVHPEEVEGVINGHLSVQMSRVRGQRNAFTGAIVAADVVVKSEFTQGNAIHAREDLKSEILELCRRTLAPHKIPAVINFVPTLDITPSGKLARIGV
jgi:acyl-CoA synthetase (AMP-forming)/AMP-acid ligase II